MKRKTKLIMKSKRIPRWKRNWNAAVKGLKLNVWNALAGLGLVTLVVLVAQWIGGM